MSNNSMATLLTDFADLVQRIVRRDFSREDKLEQMADILEGVTDELKTYCSDWKTATQQAEDGARQMAQGNEEIEETKRNMAAKEKTLEENRRRIDEEDVQLEERRKQIEKKDEQLSKRTLELEAKERLFEDKKLELERKEKLLQQQSAELEQTERNSRDKEARLQAEATVIASKESELEQSYKKWKQESDDAHLADKRRSNALLRREDHLKAAQQHLKATQETVVAMNENVNMSLAAVIQEHDEDKKLLAIIQEKHQRMKKLRQSLVQTSDNCSKQLATIGNGMQAIRHFEGRHTEVLADLREEINSLSTTLKKQAEQAKGIPKDIQVAEIEYEKLVTETERRLRRFTASIDTVTATGSRLDAVSTKIDKVRTSSSQLETISTEIDTVTANSSQLEAVSTAIDKVTDASSRLVAASTKIGNVIEDSGRLDGISSKIDNVTNVGNGLDELSTKFQVFQPAVIETLQEITEAGSKAQADASKAKANASKAEADALKAKADCQRTLVNHSLSRYDESRAKRGLGPGSPEKPVSKRRRRQNSVGSAGMLTNFGPPEPLPEDLMDRIRSPRNRGRVILVGNARHEVDTSPSRPASTPSGAQGLLGSSIGSSSSMDPATGTGQTANFNPVSSSPGTLIQSSQSTVSATAPPGLSEASDEVKDVWRQIDFPVDWDLSASNTLFQGLHRAANKKLQARSRPAGLLDSSSAQPNCFLCRVSKMKSVLDNGDDKSCSNCKPKKWKCVRVSFVTEDLANVAYDVDSQEKRWKLTIREV